MASSTDVLCYKSKHFSILNCALSCWITLFSSFLTVIFVQVGGEKMYDKARRGETVELSPRRISIFEFDIERSLDDRFYPFSVTAN